MSMDLTAVMKQVPHGDHIDYIVDGRLHHPHGDHCDDHGPVEVIKNDKK